MKIFGRASPLDNVDHSFYNRTIPLPEIFLNRDSEGNPRRMRRGLQADRKSNDQP
jgi:hypothetical protein